MHSGIKSLSVFRLNSGSSQERLQTYTEYHPVCQKPVLEIQYNELGHPEQQISWEYNDDGMLLHEVLSDADGTILEEKRFESGDDGKVHKEFRCYQDGSYDLTETRFDDKGNILEQEKSDDEREEVRTRRYRYEANRLVFVEETDQDGRLVEKISYQYNNDGLLEEEEHENHEDSFAWQKTYQYDDKGQKTRILTYDDAGELTERIRLGYDENGRVIKAEEENRSKKNVLEMQYDAQGNLILQQETDMHGNLVGKVERVFGQEKQMLESRVFLVQPHTGQVAEYIIRHEYAYFDK